VREAMLAGVRCYNSMKRKEQGSEEESEGDAVGRSGRDEPHDPASCLSTYQLFDCVSLGWHTMSAT
jgi:hypothetical protein